MPCQSIATKPSSMLSCPMNSPSATPPANTPPSRQDQAAIDYRRVERAIRFISENRERQPELSEIAAEIGLSDTHFQKLFNRWAGISPKKFLQYLTLEDAKDRLSRSATILNAAYDTGLSGPSRLHDLFVTYQHVTPGEYKTRGAGLEFRYSFHPSPFGECLIVRNERGLSGLSFVINGVRDGALDEQMRGWERARWTEDTQTGSDTVAAIFARLDRPGTPADPLSILMRGTPFQVKVWEALLKIPSGCTTSYSGLAQSIGIGKGSARALGSACAANRIGVLIPCHRVIRALGVVSHYRWGTDRKHALLAYEAAHAGAAG